MRIYIEGSAFFNRRTGVGQYASRLLSAYADTIVGRHQLTLFVPSLGGRLTGTPHPHMRLRRIPIPMRVYRRLLDRRMAPPCDLFFRDRADLVIFPNFVRWPMARTTKSIVFVYDLSFDVVPQFVDDRTRRTLARDVPRAVRDASAVATVSEHVKTEIVQRYDVPAERVMVVPPGVDTWVFNPRHKTDYDITARFGLPAGYILHTGTLEPRKNLVALVEAFSMLPHATRKSHPLVLAGAPGWKDTHLRAVIEKARPLGVHTTGYVPDALLPGLYANAALLAYPSFYEGFGMPTLEAMASGVPVVASNRGATPEAVGDAALVVNPDPTALAEAMLRVLGDPELAGDLRRKGLARAARWGWDTSASLLSTLVESELA